MAYWSIMKVGSHGFAPSRNLLMLTLVDALLIDSKRLLINERHDRYSDFSR